MVFETLLFIYLGFENLYVEEKKDMIMKFKLELPTPNSK